MVLHEGMRGREYHVLDILPAALERVRRALVVDADEEGFAADVMAAIGAAVVALPVCVHLVLMMLCWVRLRRITNVNTA